MEFINTNTDSSNNITFLHNPNMVSLDIPFLSMNIPNMVNLNPSQTQNYDTSFNSVISNTYYNENDMNDMNEMNDIETDDYHEDSTNNLGMGITNPFDNSMNINTFLNDTIYRRRNSRNRFSNMLSNILLEDETFQNTPLNDTIIESFNTPSKYKKVISEKGKSQLKEIKYNKSDDIETCCPITQEDFEEDEIIVQLPCRHCFNKEAIFKWLENENNCCPVCRYELDNKEVENKAEDYDSSFNFTEESFPPPPESSQSQFFNNEFAMSGSNLIENLTNQLLYESSVTATNQIYNSLFDNMLENLQTTSETINYTSLPPDPSSNLLER